MAFRRWPLRPPLPSAWRPGPTFSLAAATASTRRAPAVGRCSRAVGRWPAAVRGWRSACSAASLPGGGAGARSAASQAQVDRRLEEFRRLLREPDNIFVRGSEARKLFRLTRQDLDSLGKSYTLKDNPYEAGKQLKQYNLQEVVKLALSKHSEEDLLKYVSLKDASADKIYGHWRRGTDEDGAASADTPGGRQMHLRKHYWYNAPSTTTVEGRESVLQGLRVNLGICTAKGIVWFMTGSHAIFADLMHSFADVLNYGYRLMELSRSSLERDLFHPYGYAPLRYITADRSFVFLGFVGGACPLFIGALEISHGSIALGEHLFAPAAIFVLSALLESMAVRTAYQEILSLHRKEIRGEADATSAGGGMRDVLQYLREGRDVMSTATFTEASTGVVASMTGLVGLGASWYLSSGVPDVAASMVMAGMVCGVSGFLLRKSGESLLGQTLPRYRVKQLVEQLEAHPAVVNVFDVKTVLVGTDTVRFKAEVQFNPQTITERVLKVQKDADSAVPAQDAANRALLTARVRESLPQLQQGVVHEADAVKWLVHNNGLFYEALASELSGLERVVRSGLDDFRHVHIDLEPW